MLVTASPTLNTFLINKNWLAAAIYVAFVSIIIELGRNELSEQANCLLLSVLFPLLEGIPLSNRHTKDRSKFFGAHVVLLLCCGNTFWEARLENLVGELVTIRVELTSECIICSGSLYGLFLLMLFSIGGNHSSVGLEPLGSNLRLPLNELNLETGRLHTSLDLFDNSVFFNTAVANFSDIFFSACNDTLLFKFV